MPPAPAEPEGASVTATLIHDGRRIALPDAGVGIGRVVENDVVLEDDGISRRHAEIRRGDDGWTIADLGSKNGTRVNGERLRDGRRVLRTGDAIG
ncbi:MAG: hypothetical protein QOG77_3986, partial [Solirubrobacteraceae bacterium]|nr:hypothetical protein [Solirubrobacteraceae bacterium]